jgi:hypothetical protein
MLLFLVAIFFFSYTLLMLLSNPISLYLDSKIASSLQEKPSHYESQSNIVSSSISPNDSSSAVLSSLSLDTMNNNDTISVLLGPTLIDGTGDPPKQNAVIIINGNKIVAVTNETE